MPTISVVIPLYNHEKYIHATVESVLSQDLKPSEIIIVNDGSTDGSAQIMTDILHRHPDIVYWSQPNQGAYQAINAGIHRATGDLVAILNSDDCYHPQRLRRCAQVLDASKNTRCSDIGHRFHECDRCQSQESLVRTKQVFL